MYTVLVLAGIATLSFAVPQCSNRRYEIIAKPDCRGYYLCFHGTPMEMPDCPSGSVFSGIVKMCVLKGDKFDDCTTDNMPDRRPPLEYLGPLSIEEQCSLYGGLISHPSDCQAYYNCSHKYESVPAFFEQYLQECQYPELFDPDTKSCRPFEEANCGNRHEPKDACEYRSNICPFRNCIPCNIRYPSCKAKPDGMTAHESKKWSPYYVLCYKERYIALKTCPPDQEGRTQLFHPERNMCVPLEEIPKEHNGMMPDCSGRSDGNYPDDFGRCNQYTICRQDSS